MEAVLAGRMSQRALNASHALTARVPSTRSFTACGRTTGCRWPCRS